MTTMPFRRKLGPPDFLRMNLPETYWRVKIQGVAEEVRLPVTRYLLKLDEMVSRGAGLFLCGPSGVGKTAITALVAKEARARGFTVYFSTVWELRESIRTNIQFDGEVSLMERAQIVDVLILDDIRADDLDKGWFGRSEIEALAAYRTARRKVTIFTTQLPTKDLPAKLPALMAAVEASVVTLPVVGPNLREAQKTDLRRAIFGGE